MNWFQNIMIRADFFFGNEKQTKNLHLLWKAFYFLNESL